MSGGNKAKKKEKKAEDDLNFIQSVIKEKKISRKEIETLSNIDHPLFSFKYLKDISIDKCADVSFFYDFLMRLQKMSVLGWSGIRTSHKHAYGMESIPREQVVPKDQIPSFVTPEVELCVFRSNGDNRTFLGVQQGKIFYIFFIEAAFGDVCPH